MDWRDDGRVLVGCIVGGVAIGAAVATSWSFNIAPDKNVWDFITAIGTVAAAVATFAAVVAALWVALRDARTRSREAAVRANLAAARVSAELEQLINDSGVIAALCDVADALALTPPVFHEKVLGRLDVMTRGFHLEDLTALTTLPNHCAERIARGVGILNVLRDEVIRYAPAFASVENFDDMRLKAKLNTWYEKGRLAGNLLSAAWETCKVAAEIGAPLPTMELDVHDID